MSKRLYVAYGSNLNFEQMKHRCPTAKLYDTGIIEGYELQFKGRRYYFCLNIFILRNNKRHRPDKPILRNCSAVRGKPSSAPVQKANGWTADRRSPFEETYGITNMNRSVAMRWTLYAAFTISLSGSDGISAGWIGWDACRFSICTKGRKTICTAAEER